MLTSYNRRDLDGFSRSSGVKGGGTNRPDMRVVRLNSYNDVTECTYTSFLNHLCTILGVHLGLHLSFTLSGFRATYVHLHPVDVILREFQGLSGGKVGRIDRIYGSGIRINTMT